MILGGYGAFGTLVAQNLARTPDLNLIIAGRNANKAAATARTLRAIPKTRAAISSTHCDAQTCTPSQLSAQNVTLIINASGPFQQHDHSLAKTAIAARSHYIDLADARHYVTGICALNNGARDQGTTVISGASSIPGLSSAVVAQHAKTFDRLDAIEIGISPGNAFTPGIATTRSILGAIGKPIQSLIDGRWQTIYGWQNLSRHIFPQIGSRYMSNVDVPDLDLFPAHYPDLKTVSFKAGLELSALHLGLVCASKLISANLLPSLSPIARPAHAVKRILEPLGTDAGGMFVKSTGIDNTGQQATRTWHVIAKAGDGPWIPTIASAILAKRVLTQNQSTGGLMPGAYPCMNLFTIEQFEAEVSDLGLDISTHNDEDKSLIV